MMNYQYTSAGSQKTEKQRKRVCNRNCEELEHVRKVCRERLFWEETGRGKAPQEHILVNQGQLLHCGPMRGGMDWWYAPPDPPKYINMAPQMSPREPRNMQPLHSYNQYAPCHLNHPPTPRIIPKLLVSSRFYTSQSSQIDCNGSVISGRQVNGGPSSRPAQCPKPVPARHQSKLLHLHEYHCGSMEEPICNCELMSPKPRRWTLTTCCSNFCPPASSNSHKFLPQRKASVRRTLTTCCPISCPPASSKYLQMTTLVSWASNITSGFIFLILILSQTSQSQKYFSEPFISNIYHSLAYKSVEKAPDLRDFSKTKMKQ